MVTKVTAIDGFQGGPKRSIREAIEGHREGLSEVGAVVRRLGLWNQSPAPTLLDPPEVNGPQRLKQNRIESKKRNKNKSNRRINSEATRRTNFGSFRRPCATRGRRPAECCCDQWPNVAPSTVQSDAIHHPQKKTPEAPSAPRSVGSEEIDKLS